jgi:DNA-binding response OmpR family regulator
MQGAPVAQLAPQRLQLELETLSVDDDAPDGAEGLVDGEGPAGRLGTVLVVEDNRDLRRHLSEMLAGDWQVLLAADGHEGLQLARERLPDVVVSDIMMPRIDGLELLKRLRQDVRTSHLPVLLLTARQDDETRMQGYSLSADDFLAKPFQAEELRLRLRRMVDIRSNVQARLWRQLETSGQPAVRTSPASGEGAVPDLSDRDQQLLDRIRSWLEANHDDPDAGISALATFLSMEPRTLQRKLRALTGRTPAEHLRHFRLDRARRMLLETTLSIQEIAYSCGFSSPQYFSRLFAQEEGIPPTRWRDRPPG